ncbi:BOS complex subunit ncln-like isoform X2 [Lineus longissimus]|uniref:BOS complex subunit ncln-like isoform X2 n=1 Tax=Lineus longissimus TaxID=88925 RepID=UPI00315CFD0F
MLWFDEAGEVVEMFRSSFPLSFLFFVPIFIIMSPVSPVSAAQEFTVYRMQHFDLQGTQYGCRNAIVNLDVRPLDAAMLTRRCVLTKLKELTIEKFREMLTQGAGALVVMLPQRESLTEEEKEHLMDLETGMMQEEINMPVYFTDETDDLMQIYGDIKTSVNSDQAGSATEALFSSATANGFQMVVNGPQAKVKHDFKVANIQGKLSGFGIEEQLPTIAIVAHYDSYGVAPALADGADSNGSGVVVLLELARLFSKLYTNARTHAKFNFLFLLAGAGKFNYQGTKRWIEDNLDSMESSLLADVSFVLCLDTLGNTDKLNLHVSKPPKEGSSGATFLKNLEEVIAAFHPEVTFNMIHKKINLAQDTLAWEHERFSFRRLPAYTLSRLESHKNMSRFSITDTRSHLDATILSRNIRILAEALARHVYGLSNQGLIEIFNDGLSVEDEVIKSWLEQLTSQSRAAQLLNVEHNQVVTLQQAMERYLKDVKKHVFSADKRDPEFVFYDGDTYKMSAYGVKPAVFDLFLGLIIAAYLSAIYLLVQNFVMVQSMLRSLVNNRGKVKSQ